MSVLATAILLGAEKTPAEEGRETVEILGTILDEAVQAELSRERAR